MKNKINIILFVMAIFGWFILYHFLQPVTDWVVNSLLGMTPGAKLTEAIHFFIFEYPKVMLLLLLIIFVVGIVRTFFTPERTRKALEGRKTFIGNVMAAFLGIVTPFCSCSAIPLFLGFVETGVPLGVTFSFLIASPMINEVAVILLYGLFGLKTALIYISTGLTIAMIAGYIIGILKLEKWIEPWVFEVHAEQQTSETEKMNLAFRMQIGWGAVKEIVGKVWLYVALGIAIGAAAHGYVPQGFMVALMGKAAWYSVPVSVLIGIPLYSNAAGIVPIVSVLIEKGAALGTSLAFMMSVIALSLPEMIILRKVLKFPLILTFVGVVGVGIMIVGYLFNWIF